MFVAKTLHSRNTSLGLFFLIGYQCQDLSQSVNANTNFSIGLSTSRVGRASTNRLNKKEREFIKKKKKCVST